MSSQLTFRIVQDDIAAVDVDVVALKYAQAFYGADLWMSTKLIDLGMPKERLQPKNGEYALIESRGAIHAPDVLFVGTPHLRHFGYEQISEFCTRTLAVLARERPRVRSVALTLHGVGFGLDETASFQSELAGLNDSWASGDVPPGLETVILVERSARRVERLEQVLAQYIARASNGQMLATSDRRVATLVRPATASATHDRPHTPASPDDLGASRPTTAQAHAFVAMPFSETMEDIFYFGVQNPVHGAGLLCERMDHVAFTGEIIDQMKRRIETASVVVAILTGGNPNVYLEVGYAWGKGVPAILVASSVDELAFDVKGSRCLTYTSIRDLEQKLGNELRALQSSGNIRHERLV